MKEKTFPFICECGYNTMNPKEALNHIEEHKNQKEARDDANNMNLDPGEFPLTEVNDG